MSTPDLKPQTPGEPVTNTSPLATAVSQASGGNPNANEGATADAQAPLYAAKHSAGGRWWVVTTDAESKRVGDFVGDKEAAKAEADRLNAGGEPYFKPDATADAQQEPARAVAADDVDATKLKQAVMTEHGWLCPEPPAKKD